MSNLIDLTNRTFNKLTVLKRMPENNYRNKPMWLCRCECGNEVKLSGEVLKRGQKSCGMCSVNTYEIFGKTTLIYTSKNEIIIIDTKNLLKVKKYSWHYSKYGYAVTYINVRGKKKCIFMHRLIMKAPSHKEVDHIYQNTFDNRENHLKICTHKENMGNRVNTIGRF